MLGVFILSAYNTSTITLISTYGYTKTLLHKNIIIFTQSTLLKACQLKMGNDFLTKISIQIIEVYSESPGMTFKIVLNMVGIYTLGILLYTSCFHHNFLQK